MVVVPFTLETLEFFLLILVRIASFLFSAPFFSQDAMPNRTKIGFAVFVSLLLFVSMDNSDLTYSGIYGYTVLVLKEGITGLLIGFAANICSSIVLFTGRMIDMEVGLSMASVLDPSTNEQSSITGSFYNMVIMMLLVISDMHMFILRAIIDSYEVIPMGEAIFDYDAFYEVAIRFLTDYMVIAFRIVLPVFICIMMLNVVLGIMAKVAPQMNMFSVGLQLKVMVGFVVLFLCMQLMPDVANFIFKEMKEMMVAAMEALY